MRVMVFAKNPEGTEKDMAPTPEAIEAFKAMDQFIEELVQALSQRVGLRRPLFQDRRFFLDWDEVRAMVAAWLPPCAPVSVAYGRIVTSTVGAIVLLVLLRLIRS